MHCPVKSCVTQDTQQSCRRKHRSRVCSLPARATGACSTPSKTICLTCVLQHAKAFWTACVSEAKHQKLLAGLPSTLESSSGSPASNVACREGRLANTVAAFNTSRPPSIRKRSASAQGGPLEVYTRQWVDTSIKSSASLTGSFTVRVVVVVNVSSTGGS